MSRNYQIVLGVEWLEKKALQDEAKRQGIPFPDYLRLKLGLPTRKEVKEKPYEGDPDNALDVEELAREIREEDRGGLGTRTMASARREAKRRLMAAHES